MQFFKTILIVLLVFFSTIGYSQTNVELQVDTINPVDYSDSISVDNPPWDYPSNWDSLEVCDTTYSINTILWEGNITLNNNLIMKIECNLDSMWSTYYFVQIGIVKNILTEKDQDNNKDETVVQYYWFPINKNQIIK